MKKTFWIDTIPYAYSHLAPVWPESDLHRDAKRVYIAMARDFTDAYAYLAPSGHSYTESNEAIPLSGSHEWELDELAARVSMKNLDEILAVLNEMNLVTY